MRTRSLFLAMLVGVCFIAVGAHAQGAADGTSNNSTGTSNPVTAAGGIQMLPPSGCVGPDGSYNLIGWDNTHPLSCFSGLTINTSNGSPNQMLINLPVGIGAGAASVLPPASADVDLAVNGNIVIGDHGAGTPLSTDNSTTCDVPGMMRYNVTTNSFQGCVASPAEKKSQPAPIWGGIAGGGASCALTGQPGWVGPLYYMPQGQWNGVGTGSVTDKILAVEIATCNVFQCDNGTWDKTDIVGAGCTAGCTPGVDCD